MKKMKRVLLVAEAAHDVTRRAVERILAAGQQPVIARSARAAKDIHETFERGVFAFDLPDGSGIVLAAEMMLEGRVRDIEFVQPDGALLAAERCSGHGGRMR